jgi:hypothetical protein
MPGIGNRACRHASCSQVSARSDHHVASAGGLHLLVEVLFAVLVQRISRLRVHQKRMAACILSMRHLIFTHVLPFQLNAVGQRLANNLCKPHSNSEPRLVSHKSHGMPVC